MIFLFTLFDIPQNIFGCKRSTKTRDPTHLWPRGWNSCCPRAQRYSLFHVFFVVFFLQQIKLEVNPFSSSFTRAEDPWLLLPPVSARATSKSKRPCYRPSFKVKSIIKRSRTFEFNVRRGLPCGRPHRGGAQDDERTTAGHSHSHSHATSLLE